MAKFLNTRKAVSELEDLIKNAGEKLVLISPYLKLSKDFKELLTYRNGKEKITTVIFGKQELAPEEMKFLQGLRFVILKYNEDLHAKCYVNDQRMIITSLNLYGYSMANNKEMGVLVDKNDEADAQLFKDAMEGVDFIQATSQAFEFGPQQVAPKTAEPKPAPDKKPAGQHHEKPVSPNKKNGYCIRTGVEIPFNVEKPFSIEAFRKWSEFSNPDYPEKYCHFSGEPSNGETSMKHPIMKKNWKKAKEIHGF